MTMVEKLGLAALHRLDPERAHDLSIRALSAGLVPLPGSPFTSDRLRVKLAGLDLPNPIGLAAGYDKNAKAVAPLMRAGFGFIELGAATPRPQPGNPKPRLFRLTQDRAIINRFGFNNEGAEAICARLAARPRNGVPVGLNIGANKDSADRAADFTAVVEIAGASAAGEAGIPFTLSTLGTTSIEDVRAVNPYGRNWFQLYVMRNRTFIERPDPHHFLRLAVRNWPPDELAVGNRPLDALAGRRPARGTRPVKRITSA